jgi:hypothetical protein
MDETNSLGEQYKKESKLCSIRDILTDPEILGEGCSHLAKVYITEVESSESEGSYLPNR